MTPPLVCPCVKRHSPPALVVEMHHVVPKSWGGPTSSANLTPVCSQTHHSTHLLIDEYVKAGGIPPRQIVARFTAYEQELATRAWAGHPQHPTINLTTRTGGPPMTDKKVVQTVVFFLGVAGLLLITGEMWLVHSIIARDKPSDASVALISSIGTLAGATLGALGAILVSTRSGPTEAAPVVVANTANDPVPVDTTPASATTDADAGGIAPAPTDRKARAR